MPPQTLPTQPPPPPGPPPPPPTPGDAAATAAGSAAAGGAAGNAAATAARPATAGGAAGDAAATAARSATAAARVDGATLTSKWSSWSSWWCCSVPYCRRRHTRPLTRAWPHRRKARPRSGCRSHQTPHSLRHSLQTVHFVVTRGTSPRKRGRRADSGPENADGPSRWRWAIDEPAWGRRPSSRVPRRSR